ncbi:hypothetical protein K438DRAFT_1976919 [Mycena galopus ATCC 62051]|nr:hypothetical protein K438DRAFT_1976919 [Mycena galopus ATCC 62051]
MEFFKFLVSLFAIVLAAHVTSAATCGGGTVATGLVTYYNPDGDFGACGKTIGNADLSVAVGLNLWKGGACCGTTMIITCKRFNLR